jgi:hypothetical protein
MRQAAGPAHVKWLTTLAGKMRAAPGSPGDHGEEPAVSLTVSEPRRFGKEASMVKRVLAIGIEPGSADYSAFPQLTPDLVRGYIDAQLLRLRDLGYEVTSCLIDLDAAAEAGVTAALRDERFDCVVIGAGLREPKQRLLLFETVLNLVHRLAPDAAICFNTTPADTAEAVQRWIEP